MKSIVPIAMILAAAACTPKPSKPVAEATIVAAAPAEPTAATPSVTDLPEGAYKLDPSHASLIFTVNHLGFSNYTAGFSKFDAQLQLDPANPALASLVATVDPLSLQLPSPPAGFIDEMTGVQFLDAAKYPVMTFRSTAITMTGPASADIAGEFEMHGVSKPVTLSAKFNGGWAGIPPDPFARIGFSATGSLNRGDFGIGYGIPAPGSTMGVSDAVAFAIEAEFTGPPWADAPAPPPPQ